MGKAYTEEEKIEIKKRIWEAAIELFHSSDAKKLNIRTLTSMAGISLGSFYNFYPDKESLMFDIVLYRVKQKLDVMRLDFPASGKDPEKFLVRVIHSNFVSMDDKFSSLDIYKEAYTIMHTDMDRTRRMIMNEYLLYLKDLNAYWKKNGIAAKVDEKGILNLINGLAAFSEARDAMDKKYYDELLKDITETAVHRYLKKRANK
jgi:AcrR family transcriptional regulator